MIVTKAIEGKIYVKPIHAMTSEEILEEIYSYSNEDLLNADTRDRLGDLRIHAPTFAQLRQEARAKIKERRMQKKS
jgi:hypothetical protein